MAFGDVYAAEINAAMFTGTTTYYASFHTANPIAGAQNSSELTYPEYARDVLVNGTDITQSGRVVTLPNGIQCPIRVTGSTDEIATHMCIGTAASGAGKILLCVALPAPLTITVGSVPALTANATHTLN